jgi:hypothetical protein
VCVWRRRLGAGSDVRLRQAPPSPACRSLPAADSSHPSSRRARPDRGPPPEQGPSLWACIVSIVWLHHICMVVKTIILLFFSKTNDNTLVRCPFGRTCPSAAIGPNSQRRACSIYTLFSISMINPQLMTRFARRDSLRSPHAPTTSAARCPHPVLRRVVPRPCPCVSCPPLATVHCALSLAASRCC